MKDIPEFHGNPNDLDWNPEYVFNLKARNALLEKVVVAANDYIDNAYDPDTDEDLIRFKALEAKLKESK